MFYIPNYLVILRLGKFQMRWDGVVAWSRRRTQEGNTVRSRDSTRCCKFLKSCHISHCLKTRRRDNSERVRRPAFLNRNLHLRDNQVDAFDIRSSFSMGRFAKSLVEGTAWRIISSVIKKRFQQLKLQRMIKNFYKAVLFGVAVVASVTITGCSSEDEPFDTMPQDELASRSGERDVAHVITFEEGSRILAGPTSYGDNLYATYTPASGRFIRYNY